MDNSEEYKAMFSKVHTAASIAPEDLKAKDVKRVKKNNKLRMRAAVLVTLTCLILMASATAIAMRLFGLKDLVISDLPVPTPAITSDGVQPSSEPTPEKHAPVDIISLQGYSDSNEYKAVAEWWEFTESYDPDGEIVASIGNGPTGLDERYAFYNAYTQEMADKLDEIVDKYGLKLHTGIRDLLSRDDVISNAATGDFLGDANTPYSAYIYEDGTFKFDGEADMGEDRIINYQFMNCKKGTFTYTVLNITNRYDYEEWEYTTASGNDVSLSLGSNKAVLTADLGSSFVTINILAGTDESSGALNSAELEAFADTFDLSLLK